MFDLWMNWGDLSISSCSKDQTPPTWYFSPWLELCATTTTAAAAAYHQCLHCSVTAEWRDASFSVFVFILFSVLHSVVPLRCAFVFYSDKWSPALQIRTVLLSIQALLSAPNPDDPLANDVAEKWKSSEAEAIETGERSAPWPGLLQQKAYHISHSSCLLLQSITSLKYLINTER